MQSLADFLDARSGAIVELFTERVRPTLSGPDARSELLDLLPGLVGGIAGALREVEQTECAALREGYSLAAVVREHSILRDCIFTLLEQAEHVPTLREHGILASRLAAATADTVSEYLAEHHAGSAAERRHLMDLFDQAPGFLCFLRGRDLVFELANPAYYQLVGHREILGKPAREAFPEVEGQGFFELLDRVFETGVPFVGRGMPLVVQRDPGGPPSEVFVDLVYQPIRGPDGAISGLLVQGHDVTDAKHQEAQRKLAEERYRMLFESIDDGFGLLQMEFDVNGAPGDYRFLETNPAFERQTGLKDAVGKSVRELVPNIDGSWFELYGKVAKTGEALRFENHEPAMGRWFDVYASRVGNPALHQVALVFKDITARKHAEVERERLFDLERAAREQAEEAGRLRDEFLATVSHELRTPLASILGWVQMLRAGGLTEDKRARALETVERNARAQAQLIEDLLDVSRILAGKLRLELAPVDVQAIVEAALETVRPAAMAKEIRLQPTLASGCTVMGDPHRLQQVVWNLLANAVKFTPKSGRVQVVVACHDSAVEVRVVDTGKGIPAAFQPHVFDRFRQVEGGTTRSYGGLGLGLAIVRQLVEMHGGTVSVASEGEGQGSTFVVKLPLAAVSRRDVPAPPKPRTASPTIECPPELAGLNVLIVDDEVDTREMLGALLERCRVRVRLAGSAAEGLRMFMAERPDLLLSDIGMPEEDGYAFIEKVRRLPAAAGGDAPAVALTAYARTLDRTRALRAGFNNHIAKPVEPLELLAVIASLATRTRAR